MAPQLWLSFWGHGRAYTLTDCRVTMIEWTNEWISYVRNANEPMTPHGRDAWNEIGDVVAVVGDGEGASKEDPAPYES